jgi:hypothetical protein
MEAIINFFTVTPADSVVYVLIFGVVFIVIGWFNEVFQVFKRIRYLTSESTRGLVTWHTWVWMPVRLFVIVILPQVIYQFFTEVVKFV